MTPSGTLHAVCFGVWDLGMQKAEFNGKPVIQHKVIVGWETFERIESNDEWDGQRYRLYRRYTLSLNEKASLCKDLNSWRGKNFTDEERKGFDLETLIGSNCFLNVIHKEGNGKTYANVAAVTSLAKGIQLIKPENDPAEPEWVAKIKAQAVSEAEVRVIEEEAQARDEQLPF